MIPKTDAQAIADAIDPESRVLVLTMIGTGARIGEVMALRVSESVSGSPTPVSPHRVRTPDRGRWGGVVGCVPDFGASRNAIPDRRGV